MTMRFGDFVALDKCRVKVRPGTFHALLGENGAGKSTLVKCIMGYYHADAGRDPGRRPRGRRSPIRSDAHALGLGMVYQHFTLVPAMTVAENLVLARDDVPAVIDWAEETQGSKPSCRQMPFTRAARHARSRTSRPARSRSARFSSSFISKRRFLILDEPTSVLTPGEADEVLGMLRDMAQDGELTILMITHKFREVMAFADEVTVLRRGKLAGNGLVKELTPDAMARDDDRRRGMTDPAAALGRGRQRAARARKVCALDDAGAIGGQGASLSVRGGEIVGIAGVSGNGQRELVEVLAGQREAESGEIRVAGERLSRQPRGDAPAKMSLLPEEPLHNACVAGMSVADNMAFREFDRAPFARAAGGSTAPRSAASRAQDRPLKIKTRTPDTPISSLSGGNVQRAVLARELGGDVEVLIAANPCFGLDFAAVAQIHAEIMAARNRGAAVLLVSEDLDELLELSDRLVVMFHGQFVYEARASEADLTEVGRHMAGH